MSKHKKQGGSLQDQLRQAGLVTEKQLKKAEKGMHRQEMRVKRGIEIDEIKTEALQARQAKLKKDRETNASRDETAAAKAILAQIKQLVEMNSQREQGNIEYNFTDSKRVKKIYISESNKVQLNKGFLAIVKSAQGYDLVPEKVARKIMARNQDTVLYLYDRTAIEEEDDDPYKEFKIPDDLDW